MPPANPSDRVLVTLNHVLDLQWSRSCLIAALTVLVYDHVLTFENEFKFIWMRPWSTVKGIFIWARYFTLIYATAIIVGTFLPKPTNAMCVFYGCFVTKGSLLKQRAFFGHFLWQMCVDISSHPYKLLKALPGYFFLQWEGWAGIVLMVTADALMLLWVHAIWNRNRKILIGTAILFGMEITSVTILLAIGFKGEKDKPRLIPTQSVLNAPGAEQCSPFSLPSTFWKCWIPIATFEGILMTLTMYKAYEQWMVYMRRGQHGKGRSIRDTLLQNSLLQVFAIFLSYLACCITWLTSEPDRTPDLLGFAVVFSITMCCRLMLRIRDAFYNQEKVVAPHTPAAVRASFGEDVQGRADHSVQGSIYVGPQISDDWECELREMRPESRAHHGVKDKFYFRTS